LTAEDMIVECLIGQELDNGHFVTQSHFPLQEHGTNDQGETVFHLELTPNLPGLQHYKIRVYPYHTLLSHPLEMGRMIWL